MESHERAAVRRGLDALKPYLAAFVAQRSANRLASPDSDIAGLLRTILDQWDATFRGHLPPVARSYVHELRDIRNRWAHEATFTPSEVSRALDTMRQLTAAIGAPADPSMSSIPQVALPTLEQKAAGSRIAFGEAALPAEVAPLQSGRTTDFWSAHHFDFADALNEEIWLLSPEVQEQIQSVDVLREPGGIGAQQAMLDTTVLAERGPLPWVPDLVGKDWRDESGVVVVGYAYAGFIREYSTRSTAMPLDQYLAASSVEDFQNLFLRYVVREDPNYYTPLQNLCSTLGSASRISLVDLCRVSLVKRGVGDARRSDSSSGIVKEGPAIFAKYTESVQAAEWLWRRFVDGQARCVLALGTTAEHGLLRLFARREMTITQNEVPFSASPIAHGAWANEYADPSRKLGYWLTHETWWTIRGQVNGTDRIWYVLPVYHPARHESYDRDYQRTKKVLKLMQASVQRLSVLN